jgi:hypothetical protein
MKSSDKLTLLTAIGRTSRFFFPNSTVRPQYEDRKEYMVWGGY